MAGGGATASGVAEHRFVTPAPPAAGKAATPERRLVRLVALVERAGHALGTLAFTWATVVLLGGYLTVLGSSRRIAPSRSSRRVDPIQMLREWFAG
ncbi:hypothetical protein ZWY2020_043923 [Hordeum vulgare]|nr:hypothetical protein ZWY2020_043923 [Hordeum vulgare]